MLYQPGVTVDDLSLDDEQRQAARQITEADGCVHALWSAAGGGKSYILAVLLAAWARIAGQTALAIYVTSRKKHRDPILKLLRDKLSKEEVWINAGDSEVQDKENHLMAGVGASSDIALARALNRLQELDEKIDAVGPKEPAALALHAERVQVLFVNILWKRHEQMQAMLTGTKIMVMTADLARKTLSKTPVWARNRQLQVLIHDEIENSSFTEFISLAAHFDFVITAGDKPQRLEQAKNTYRGMPGHDPEERQTGTAQSLPSSALPLYPIYTTATDFLVPHANNVRLHTVRRWGQTIGDLLHQLGEERVTCRCSHDTVLHKIQLSGSLWEDVGLRSGVTCVFGRTLFTLITSVAKAWLQQRMTVGIIVLYRHSVNVLETWRSGLQEEEQARIAVGTPETVQGDTFHKVIFLSLQRRKPEETAPGGHSTHAGRRLVGLTRASHELLILAEAMERSVNSRTSQFQSLFDENVCLDRAEESVRLFRALDLPEPTLQSFPWPEAEHFQEHTRTAAVEFMQKPSEWQAAWTQMEWQPPNRQIPAVPAPREDNEENATALLIPTLPMVSFGRTSIFMPLNFVLPEAASHHDNQDTNAILDGLMRKCADNNSSYRYSTRHHKLKSEEFGGDVSYYAQACNTLRAAHVLENEYGKDLLKVYHGMGTELQRDEVASLVLTASDMPALSAFLEVLVTEYGCGEAWHCARHSVWTFSFFIRLLYFV